jgi:hypothetical protein
MIERLAGDELAQLAARILANAWRGAIASCEPQRFSRWQPDDRTLRTVPGIPLAMTLRPIHSLPSRNERERGRVSQPPAPKG